MGKQNNQPRGTTEQIRVLEQVFNRIRDFIVIADPKDRILFANDSFLKWLGYSLDELVGQPVSIIHSPKNPAGCGRQLHEAVLAGGWTGELIEVAKDGREITNFVSISPVRDENGSHLMSVGIGHDITEQKRAAAASRYLLEFEELMVGLSTMLIGLTSEEMDRGINQALQRIGEFAGVDRSYVFQFSADGTRITNTHEWCAPGIESQRLRIQEMPVDAMPWMMMQFEQRESVCIISRVADLPPEARAEKSELEAQKTQSLIAVPLVCRRGPLGFVGFDSVRMEKTWTEDIVALLKVVGEVLANALVRKRTEEALQSERDLLQALMDNIPDTIYFKDLKSRFTRVNQSQAKLLGLARPKDAIGKTDFDFFTPEHAEAAFADEERIIASGEPLIAKEEHIKRADGRWRWMTSTKVPILDGDGKVIGLVGISRDVTNEKEREQHYVMMQKMASVSALTSGIAHEFNNLLTGVVGYAELLLSRLPPDSQTRSYAEQIKRAATEATELTQQLSAFSHTTVVNPQDVELREIVVAAIKLVAGSVPTEIQFVNRTEACPDQVRGDGDQLQHALVTILLNACEAMPEGGEVTTELHPQQLPSPELQLPLPAGRYVALTVRDTGRGMDADTRSRAFEPFFTTKSGTHSGLGLTAAYGIVEMHGGTIQIASSPGQGTTVCVVLPAARTEVPVAATATPPPRDTATILLVEDEDIPREFQSHVLESEGFRVLAAKDGQQGLRTYCEFADDIDLIVTDIVMPVMSGDAMVAGVRRVGKPVRILVVTGYTGTEAANKLRALGVDGFIQKPFTGDALLQRVRQILGLPAKR
jgi:PAS domain S-box-containing protein